MIEANNYYVGGKTITQFNFNYGNRIVVDNYGNEPGIYTFQSNIVAVFHIKPK